MCGEERRDAVCCGDGRRRLQTLNAGSKSICRVIMAASQLLPQPTQLISSMHYFIYYLRQSYCNEAVRVTSCYCVPRCQLFSAICHGYGPKRICHCETTMTRKKQLYKVQQFLGTVCFAGNTFSRRTCSIKFEQCNENNFEVQVCNLLFTSKFSGLLITHL